MISGSYVHLWYLNATIVAFILVAYMLKKNIKPKNIVIIAAVFYFIGLLAQSWFGLIRPLNTNAPEIWCILKLVQKVIVNTRYVLFVGFIFVSLGMYLALMKITFPMKQSYIGFIVSVILLSIEITVLHYLKIPRTYEIFMFLIPTAFFLFYIVSNINLSNNYIYIKLRILSSLIYFLHVGIKLVVDKLIAVFNVGGIEGTPLRFICVLLITVIISLLIIKLSNFKKLKWLKKLYA